MDFKVLTVPLNEQSITLCIFCAATKKYQSGTFSDLL